MQNNLTASELMALMREPSASATASPTEPVQTPSPVNSTDTFTAPVVSVARTQLNEFTPGLSASQQYARDRAAQDRLLTETYAKTGAAPLSNMEFRNLQQQLRSGAITSENIQEKLINPIYEQRVANAYKAIGRTGPIVPAENIDVAGATADTVRAIDREGYDYWLNQLKTGQLTGQQFQDTFLNAAAAVPTGENAKLKLDATNKARAALGLPAITESQLPGYQAPPPVQNTAWNMPGFVTGTVRQPTTAINPLFNLGNLAPLLGGTAAPVVVGNVVNPGKNNYSINPVDFSAAPPAQLFNKGGPVKK